MKHVIVYSHGFGVRKDDRGLFTDIAEAMPDNKHVMFDYNQFDESQNTLTVLPLPEQATMLSKKLDQVKINYPGATIDLICHSQGCVVSALAKPASIRKTIFLTPPTELSSQRLIEIFGSREGTEINPDGESRLIRRDGSTTIVPAEYWKTLGTLNPITLYKQLAEVTELIIVKAKRDEVLGNTDFSELSSDSHTIELDGNHDFTGDARQILVNVVYERLT